MGVAEVTSERPSWSPLQWPDGRVRAAFVAISAISPVGTRQLFVVQGKFTTLAYIIANATSAGPKFTTLAYISDLEIWRLFPTGV